MENKTKLTPIEKYGYLYLKRDDKFILGNVNGGKVRQAIYLIEKNLEEIKGKYNREVICSCSIKSPQSAIISEVCKKYGLKCKIVTYKTIKPNINLTIAKDNGAVLIQSPSGYTSVIESIAKKQSGFWINMGFASPKVIEANISQVKNLPEDLDYLVVPVGSAMNFISILKGLEEYGVVVKKGIIGIYVGKDPKPTLEKYYFKNSYMLIKSKYSYGTYVNVNNYFFDPIYEAKTYKWIEENLDYKNNKVLLWVVGKRNLNYKTKNN
jgi:1-aminocyclopropane-1-carboxylate deaminase/D-cysteine desulfhydrase-like pyridoxal-dependent ACC family enzyme